LAGQCPKCGAEIDLDFGIITCPQCSTVLSVELDGQISQVDANAPPQPSEAPAGSSSLDMPEGIEPDLSLLETPIEPDDGAIEVEEATRVVEENTLTIAPDRPFVKEMTDFANKELSSGPLTYSILIEGIDLADTRTAVLEALSDRKFDWDSETLRKKIRLGGLRLEGLSTAQAVMVIRRLQGIAVRISWRQHVYS